MTRPNWPTAEAINARIARSAKANDRLTTKLSGKGTIFLRFGKRYGINPAVAVAIAQRECQLAADGSKLPTWNNFGGITDPTGKRGTCGREYYIDRPWAKYCTVDEGIEAIFQVLNGALYRKTDGSFAAIMHLYSPQFENDWADMWKIFAAVGTHLGVRLDLNTPVYSPPSLATRLRNRLRRR